MLAIDIKAPRFECCLELHSKITVIRGDSGRGKTQFVINAVSPDPSCTVTISDPLYNSIFVAEGRYWYSTLSARIELHRRGIVIVDNAEFIKTQKFADLVAKDKLGYYILITRFEDIGHHWDTKSSCDIEVCEFVCEGRKHFIVPVQNN